MSGGSNWARKFPPWLPASAQRGARVGVSTQSGRCYLARLSGFFVLVAFLGEGLIRYRRRTKRFLGFTLVELLLALAIMGTLVAVAVPKLQDTVDRARITRAIADISVLQTELAGFENPGALPEFLSEIGRGDMLDPWGNAYVYMNFGTSASLDQHWGGTEGGTEKPRKDKFLVPLNTFYDLYSKGKDGDSDEDLQADKSQDDVIRANDGGYIGLASQY